MRCRDCTVKNKRDSTMAATNTTTMATTVTATNHDDQLGEIYPTMLNVTFGVSFSRFHCCGCRGHALWRSWLWPSWFVAVMV